MIVWYTMEVEFKTKRSFTSILDTLSALSIDHVVLQFTKDGLCMSCMDPNHISLVNVTLDRTYFKTFTLDKSYRIGILIPMLLKIFKSIHKDESVSFSYQEAHEYLNVHIFSSITKRDQHFKINEINIDVEEIEPSVSDYVWAALMTGGNFKNLLKHSSIIEAADCSFQVEQDKIVLHITGDLGSSQITYTHKENMTIMNIHDLVDKEVDESEKDTHDMLLESFNQTFSLTMLQHFTKLSISDKQYFQFIMHPQKPICIKTFFNDRSFIECYLSPKFVED